MANQDTPVNLRALEGRSCQGAAVRGQGGCLLSGRLMSLQKEALQRTLARPSQSLATMLPDWPPPGLTVSLCTSPQRGYSKENDGMSKRERLMTVTEVHDSLGAIPKVPKLFKSKGFAWGRCRSGPTLRGSSCFTADMSVTGCNTAPAGRIA